MKKMSFTLAEILIVLGIIGLIADMTLPTLINSYEKKVTIVKLKKVYTNLSQTTIMAQAEQGDIKNWDVGETNNLQSASDFADKYLLPYLRTIEKCGTKTTGQCEYTINYLHKNGQWDTTTTSTKFVLTDGTLATLSVYNNNSDGNGQYIIMFFDINGFKKPNTFGKDVFRFNYFINFKSHPEFNGTLQADGLQLSTREEIKESGCTKANTGLYCAALIIRDGWEIKNDYPW